MMTIPDVCRYL